MVLIVSMISGINCINMINVINCINDGINCINRSMDLIRSILSILLIGSYIDINGINCINMINIINIINLSIVNWVITYYMKNIFHIIILSLVEINALGFSNYEPMIDISKYLDIFYYLPS